MPIDAPIILDENGDTSIFDSVESVLRYIEAIDVKNGEYVAYDSKGRWLHLSVISDRVQRGTAEVVPLNTNGLHGRLRKFLIGPKRWLDQHSVLVLEQVRIKPAEVEPLHADELQEILRKFLTHILLIKHLPHDWVAQAPLEELVQKSLEYKRG